MAYPGPFPFKVEQGGTGEITLLPNAVLVGENADDIGVTNVGTNGQVLLGATAAKPQFATLTSTGGTVTYTLGVNSLNLEAGGSVAITFAADSGTATPALNTITFAGGTNVTTSASGSTVTIDAASTGIQTINGNVGSVTGPTVTLTTGAANANGTGLFTGVGTTMTMTYEDGTSNLGIGGNALKNATITSSSNIAIGTNVFNGASFAAANNIGIGINAGSAVTIGANNLLLGGVTGQDITSGSFNVGLGFNVLNNLITGNRNIVIGEGSGNSLTGAESSNIIIGWQTPGTVAQSNALIIGKATGTGNGEQNKAFIHGIDGINVGSVAKVVTMASDQLGTATITAGTGISVTPGANTITLAASAATPLVFHTGSGDATPAANAVTIAGGNNISTTGAGSTVTVAVTGTTNHAIQVGNASGSLTSLTAATNGQIPIGSTGVDPVIATITAGTGITVTNGAGSITIASTAGSFPWTEVTGTSAGMAVNNGYIANNAGLVTLTIPTTAAIGDIVRVTGKGAGGWLIAQNAGETIYFGASTTTTGVGGSLASTLARDGIELVCVTANNDWNVLSVQGNLTVV